MKGVSIILVTSSGSQTLANCLFQIDSSWGGEKELLVLEHETCPSVRMTFDGRRSKSKFPVFMHEGIKETELRTHFSGIVHNITFSFSDLLRKAIKQSLYDSLLFFDDSLMMSKDLADSLQKTIEHGQFDAVAIPVRNNMNRKGSVCVYSAIGNVLFQYALVHKKVFQNEVDSLELDFRNHYLDLSFWLTNRGCHIQKLSDGRYVDRNITISDQIEILQHESDHYVNEVYWRRLNQINDYETAWFQMVEQHSSIERLNCVKEIRKIFDDGCLALLTGNQSVRKRNLSSLKKHLKEFFPELSILLESQDYKVNIIQLLKDSDSFVELFYSKLDLLNFLILYYFDELVDGSLMGDKDFWFNFRLATFNHQFFVDKLINLKV